MQCLVPVTAADSNMGSGLEFKCFGRSPEAKMWSTLFPNGSPKQLLPGCGGISVTSWKQVIFPWKLSREFQWNLV